jgi:hypothetical protein
MEHTDDDAVAAALGSDSSAELRAVAGSNFFIAPV